MQKAPAAAPPCEEADRRKPPPDPGPSIAPRAPKRCSKNRAAGFRASRPYFHDCRSRRCPSSLPGLIAPTQSTPNPVVSAAALSEFPVRIPACGVSPDKERKQSRRLPPPRTRSPLSRQFVPVVPDIGPLGDPACPRLRPFAPPPFWERDRQPAPRARTPHHICSLHRPREGPAPVSRGELGAPVSAFRSPLSSTLRKIDTLSRTRYVTGKTPT